MIKYFKPRTIIEFLEQNKDNLSVLEEKFTKKFISENYSTYSRDFLGKFKKSDLFEFLSDIYNYIKLNDENYNPEIKVDVTVNNENWTTCRFRSYTIALPVVVVKNFFYDKEDELEKYKNINQSQFALPNSNSLATTEDFSMQDVEDKKASVEEEIKKLQEEQENQLKILQEEFALKVSQMKQQMAQKMESTVRDICESKDELAKMERKLYRWLTYNGHSFEIQKIASGDNAPKDAKFVIWQKLRYLDEELPKLLAYDSGSVSFEKFTTFEKLLSEYPVIRNYFLPTEKCCVAFQLSRDSERISGRFGYGIDETATKRKDVRTWINYIESSYALANYNKLGLYFRNGDNVYVAWLDKDKISIKSDSLFFTNVDSNNESEFKTNFREFNDVTLYAEKDKGQVMLDNLKAYEDNYDKKIELENQFSARVYILDVIQGILNNQKDILDMPDGQDVLQALTNKSYRDIIFNSADGYITNLKWKSFDEILPEITPEENRVGDLIYVLVNDGGKDRGKIGSYQRGRTDFASITKGVHKINLIQYEDIYHFYRELKKEDFTHIEKDEINVANDAKEFYIINVPELEYYNKERYSRNPDLYQYLKDGTYRTVSLKLYKKEKVTNPKDAPRFSDTKEFYGFDIDNFEDTLYFRLRFKVTSVKTTKRLEEPFVSRTKKVKNPRYFGWDKNVPEFIDEEANEVLKTLKKSYRYEIEHGFVEDLALRERKLHYYIEGGRYTKTNLKIYEDEFFPLKLMTDEHINYMINNKLTLPRMTISETLNALLRIKEALKENNKKKEE